MKTIASLSGEALGEVTGVRAVALNKPQILIAGNQQLAFLSGQIRELEFKKQRSNPWLPKP
jgi:hypothetical protein